MKVSKQRQHHCTHREINLNTGGPSDSLTAKLQIICQLLNKTVETKYSEYLWFSFWLNGHPYLNPVFCEKIWTEMILFGRLVVFFWIVCLYEEIKILSLYYMQKYVTLRKQDNYCERTNLLNERKCVSLFK